MSRKADNLLLLFKDLKIDLGNVNPNVIHGWYDTDDVDMINFLNWMSTAITEDNYVPPQQQAEYDSLEAPLSFGALEESFRLVEQNHPGILDVEDNLLEIQTLEDHRNALEEVECDLNDLSEQHENLHITLSNSLSTARNDEFKSSVALTQAEDDCLELARELDGINRKIFEQLERYGMTLCNFENEVFPRFFNNMDVKDNWDSFHGFFERLRTLMHEVESLDDDMSMNISASVMPALLMMQNRIYNSYKRLISAQISEEMFDCILNYLNSSTVNSMLMLDERFLQKNIDVKQTELSEIIDTISTKYSENCILKPKLKYAQQELEFNELKLQQWESVNELVVQILSQYVIFSILYKEEKLSFIDAEHFFRYVLKYVSTDLEMSSSRTNQLVQISEDFQKYKTRSDAEKFKLIKLMVDVLTNEDNLEFSLQSAWQKFQQFHWEIDSSMKNSLFRSFRSTTKQMENQISLLKKRLTSGPTKRIVCIPIELIQIVNDVEELIRKQNAAIKSALVTFQEKVAVDKWDEIRRDLWMNFLTDPRKLKSVFRQIENYKNQKLS